MATVDYLSALGAGSDLNTTDLVNGLVEAERAPRESSLNSKIDGAQAEISAYGEVLAAISGLETAFNNLNDAIDFSDYRTSLTGNLTSDSTPAFTFTESASITSPGVFSVAVSSIAKPERLGSDLQFDSLTSSINGGEAFVINHTDAAGKVTSVNISTPTPEGVVSALNAANLGITASTIDTGNVTGGRYKIVVASDTGASNSFTLNVGGVGANTKTLATSGVDTSTDRITLTGHGFVTGDVLTYDANGGTAIAGLTDAVAYHVIRVDDNTFSLATSASNASGGTAIDITGAGNNSQTFTSESTGTTSTVATSAVTISTPTVATTAVSTTDDSITLSGHGYSTGDVIKYRAQSGTAIAGLTDEVEYFVIRVDANTFKLATTSANATAGTQVDLTGTGNNAQTFTGNANDAITISSHGYVTGDKVLYSASGGTVLGGLADATVYSVIRVDDNSFKLATTSANAAAGINIDLTGTGNGSQTFRGPANSFLGTTAVSTTADTLTMTAHNYSTGDVITYNANGGTAIGGLADATAYHVIRVDANTIKLAASAANATAGTHIDLTGTGNSAQSFFGRVGLSFGDSLSTASDATLTVDGVSITRTTNSVADVIPGVTLELIAPTSSTASLTISQSTAEADLRIRALVDAFNQSKSVFDDLGKVGGTNANSGVLASSGTLRFVQDRIERLFTAASSTATTNLTYLNDIGVSFNRYGILTIDETRLGSALSSKYSDIVSIFSADTNNQSSFGTASRGLAGDALKTISDLVATDGPIMTATSNLESRAKDYTEDLVELDRRMEAIKARYIAQFTAMNAAVDQINSTRDYLKDALAALPFTNKD